MESETFCKPISKIPKLQKLVYMKSLEIKAATILRLLGSETIHFNTRGKKSEPGLRKQLNIDENLLQNSFFFFKYLYILQI